MNLADIKRDLRVTHSDDDELLQIYLDAAKDQALRFIDRTELPMVEPADPESSSSSSEPVLELPGSIRAALLLLVRAMYDAADAKEIEALRQAAETMLMPYRINLGA